MRVIHVLRKPLSEGTVAANVVKHGCGGLNIDASRVAAPGETISNHSRGDESAISKGIYGDSAGQETHQTEGQKSGRWPANVILQHLDGCRCDGTKRVRNPSGKASGPTTNALGDGERYGEANGDRTDVPFYADTDGKESVANWICEPGCPVAGLDEQSGASKSTGGRIGNKGGGRIYGGGKGLAGAYSSGDPGFGDTGGASRFFKQIGGEQDV